MCLLCLHCWSEPLDETFWKLSIENSRQTDRFCGFYAIDFSLHSLLYCHIHMNVTRFHIQQHVDACDGETAPTKLKLSLQSFLCESNSGQYMESQFRVKYWEFIHTLNNRKRAAYKVVSTSSSDKWETSATRLLLGCYIHNNYLFLSV